MVNRSSLILIALALAAVASATPAGAQATLEDRANAALAAERHAEAVELFRQAIAAEPGRRADLVPRLARALLWSDHPGEAARLFAEHLGRRPDDCDARLLRALALSWDDRLGESLIAYEAAERACPALAADARLGRARVLRWMDRTRSADTLYRDVAANAEEHEARAAARVGLALDALARDDNRRALSLLAAETAAGNRDSGAWEGRAAAAARIGLGREALAVLDEADRAGVRGEALDELRAHLEGRSRLAFTPAVSGFEDGDGTRYRALEASAAVGWLDHGSLEARYGAATLSSPAEDLDSRWAGLGLEHRFSAALAMRLDLRGNEFEALDFRPVTGELDLVVTPGDRTRIDVAAARILIADNRASLGARLEGDFFSVGLDQRLSPFTTLVAATDLTRWSEGNERRRLRFSLEHRFEGVPRVTISWPTLYQTYDEPFRFALFSPDWYIESGPALNVYARRARFWHLSGYLRLGALREAGHDWQPLAQARVAVERELWVDWGLRAELGWSNSNLASSSGFRRLSGGLSFTGRL